MKKLNIKSRIILIAIGITFLLLFGFLILNLLLKNKNYYDEKLLKIGHTVACGVVLISFINGLLTSKNKMFINLSLGKNREETFRNFNYGMLFITFLVVIICLAEQGISYFVWNDLIVFSIENIMDILFLGLLMLFFGYIGFILGLYSLSHKVNIVSIVTTLLFYIIMILIVSFNIKLYLYLIINFMAVIIIYSLYLFSKKKIMTLEF